MPVDPGMDASRLDKCSQVAIQVANKDITVTEAVPLLQRVLTETSPYPPWAILLVHMIVAATSSLLWFDATWLEGFLAAIGGLIVGVDCTYISGLGDFGRVESFLGSSMVSLYVHLLDLLLPSARICYAPIALGSITWLLPGLSLTTATSELAARATVPGSARMVNALMCALQLAFGLSFSYQLTHFGSTDTCIAHPLPETLPLIFHKPPLWLCEAFLWIGPATGFAILSGSNLHQLVPTVAVAAIGFWAGEISTLVLDLDPDAVNFTAAAALGAACCVYTIMGHHPMVLALPGVCMLVPGTLGVRAVAALTGPGGVLSGTAFLVQTFESCICLAAGLFMAKVAATFFYMRYATRGVHLHEFDIL
eukprot:NODE_588_length_1329_cov_195.219531_g461_i0.p1 GENE.NODE_588_length_1329_cov_195.219531_g461_i0~~NODE_588_length_1329_cov_195.219531_g461_i0.p1  ORF type:complete len:365 (-),score=29.85 NODE_588_length_1329_cov_195.219531_g461_i0:122-1216(-)